MKGHLKEPPADTRVQAGVSVSLSRNSSQKSEVLRQRFATQKPLKAKGMRPSCGTLKFCDTRLLSTLRPPSEPKWPLVTRLLGLGPIGERDRACPSWDSLASRRQRPVRPSPRRAGPDPARSPDRRAAPGPVEVDGGAEGEGAGLTRRSEPNIMIVVCGPQEAADTPRPPATSGGRAAGGSRCALFSN